MPQTFKSIVQPTDFDPAGRDAFAHGLKLALASKGRLALVHSERGDLEDAARLEGFPGVRDTLASWGLLDLDSPAESVEERLGLRVSKVDLGAQNPVDGLVAYIERHAADLIVLATHARDGLPRWLIGSIAETIAQKSHVATLFLPHGTRGFVAAKTGALHLANILVPVDTDPLPHAALAAAGELVERLDAQSARLHTLHVGPAKDAPPLDFPAWLGARIEQHRGEGPVVDTITAMADTVDADLIVMTTAGRHGFLDALRGSTTEAVLRHAHRPLLAVPA